MGRGEGKVTAVEFRREKSKDQLNDKNTFIHSIKHIYLQQNAHK